MRKSMNKQTQFKLSAMITKMYRMSKELEETAFYLEKNINKKRPQCEKCGIRDIRPRLDKSYFCRSCGYDSRIKK